MKHGRSLRYALGFDMFAEFILMRHSLILIAVSFATSLSSAVVQAAPISVNGATFDAPASCANADAALVCKVDGQQFELWVTRKPLAPHIAAIEPMARKMLHFSEVHEAAVANIMRSTGNDKKTSFASFGNYSALGAAMPGKGTPASPAVRFASVLHDEEIWEFLEVVASRSPAVDALSGDLQRSLILPSAPMPSATTPDPKKLAGATPPAQPAVPTVSGPLLSMQYPEFLVPQIIENSATRFAVNFKHKARNGGPNLMVTLRSPKDKTENAASVVATRKSALTAMMTGESGSVDVSALGDIKGVGFAFIGVPDAKKGLSGVESIETTFASDTAKGLLEVRLGAEQKYTTDTRDVWALLAKSIKLGK